MENEKATIAEKVSFIQGLAEGIKINTDTPEGKILSAIIDVLGDISQSIKDMSDEIADVAEIVDDLEDSVIELEDEVYGEDDDDTDIGDEDDDTYEITCPSCSNTVVTDFSTIADGEIVCPNCGSVIEFDIEEEDDK